MTAPQAKDNPANFSEADKQELQNVKQLCLTVMKGQKKLVREVGRVKNTVGRNSFIVESGVEPKEEPAPQRQVTIEDVQALEERQKKHLKAHLIALDMKEQGTSSSLQDHLVLKFHLTLVWLIYNIVHFHTAMRAYVARMENKILESLEVTKQEYEAERYENALKGLRDQLHTAARRMDDFIGSLEHRMADFEVRMDHEARVNANFRSGLERHLDISQQDASQQEGFEVISIVENTPFVFATPYRKPVTEEDVPLCPKKGAVVEKKTGTCLWPNILFRRKDPTPILD